MHELVEAKGPHTTLADRKRRAGQRIVLGFEDFAPTADFRRLVAEIQPAGFVLFKRNISDPEQVRELNRELATLCDEHYPALICVDQEGGRVQRIRAPATVWPPMRTVGNAKGDTSEIAFALANELRAMGFNLNFAPVADVDSNPANPVIGDRSFSRSPQAVAQHVVAWIQGQQRAGVIGCAKHFPGHGDTDVDSHLDLPRVEKDLPELFHTELVPFRAAVAAGVATIMTAHVLFPEWDEEVPATMSERILKGVLREKLGFGGVIFSDDMDMGAVRGRYSVRRQVRMATAATVDIFLCCRSPELQYEVFRELVLAQEELPDLDRASKDSARRIDAMRKQHLGSRMPDLAVVGQHAYHQLAERTRERGEG